MTFVNRWKLANSYVKKDPTNRLTIVPNYLVKTKKDIEDLLAKNLADGYEGVMIRDPKSVYQGRRSYFLQKYKKFDDEEFEVVGFEEGQGNDIGTVIWVCKTTTGKTFSVRPKGTREDKKKLFQNAKDYIGEMLTVKFQDYTVAGIPRFPVGITFRDYE
jgi:DNA ligase-1